MQFIFIVKTFIHQCPYLQLNHNACLLRIFHPPSIVAVSIGIVSMGALYILITLCRASPGWWLWYIITFFLAWDLFVILAPSLRNLVISYYIPRGISSCMVEHILHYWSWFSSLERLRQQLDKLPQPFQGTTNFEVKNLLWVVLMPQV